MRRYQFVWWGWPLAFRGYNEDGSRVWGLIWTPGLWGWGFDRPGPESSWSKVWRWRLFLGPLEIRRWVPRAVPETGGREGQ
jgi:hypothetical protein